MLANVLNSKNALEASIQVVRTFIRIRAWIISHKDLARRLDDLEKKYDNQFKVVFQAIRELMEHPPEKTKPKIGFNR
jgi:hypothetical protein